MCLAIPGKVITIDEGEDALFRKGKVSFSGITREVNLCMVPEAVLGDYVLVHVGVAIGVVNEEEAKEIFSYLEQMGDLEELL
ncbi:MULTISPECIES: HypC/HybG/HupF family hydrogenase formation chaperone [unclassified Chitinophaga]|uniref:HypC/HybG/HupF family hydrogenase formation chaperone n=1 Tax=unclassified Chitinophaga TaxID=2619133 RepID=UPI0009CFEAB2|nr:MULTISPECIES: HypC/HybG/HupF family hydrogenase formation chaperone [unclassified Chitinophaga]OMP76722.1 hydrogenase assembly protein HypC [[Flexibacter] sp. ATCC 35208]WPV70459.1 HypC/HybG/HupF family hydrogenase formation chaperone [Chitinophaga sp. LS1]